MLAVEEIGVAGQEERAMVAALSNVQQVRCFLFMYYHQTSHHLTVLALPGAVLAVEEIGVAGQEARAMVVGLSNVQQVCFCKILVFLQSCLITCVAADQASHR